MSPEARRGHQILCNWSHRQLWAAVWNWTWVFWESSQCSLMLRHLYSPLTFTLWISTSYLPSNPWIFRIRGWGLSLWQVQVWPWEHIAYIWVTRESWFKGLPSISLSEDIACNIWNTLWVSTVEGTTYVLTKCLGYLAAVPVLALHWSRQCALPCGVVSPGEVDLPSWNCSFLFSASRG